jgi:hypothetical protein
MQGTYDSQKTINKKKYILRRRCWPLTEKSECLEVIESISFFLFCLDKSCTEILNNYQSVHGDGL